MHLNLYTVIIKWFIRLCHFYWTDAIGHAADGDAEVLAILIR